MKNRWEYILEVAKLKSIFKASESLYISPSALSKHIQNVENTYNVKLFDRIGKLFHITYAGERYIRWANELLKIEKMMDSEMKEIANLHNGLITVGVPFSFSRYFVRNVYEEFRKKYPQIKVIIKENRRAGLNRLVSDNEVDFAISNVLSKHEHVNYWPVCEGEIVLAAHRDDELRKFAVKKEGFRYPWVPLSAINGKRFIMPSQEQYARNIIDELCQNDGLSVSSLIEMNSTKTMIDCVCDGLGITIMADMKIFTQHFTGQVLPISFGTNPITQQWMISSHKKHTITDTMQILMDIAHEKFSKMWQAFNEY